MEAGPFRSPETPPMDVGTSTQTRRRALTHTHAHLVVPQQEGQQHEHAAVVHNPPDVDAALREALRVTRKHGNVLGDQQSQVTGRGFPDQLWRRPKRWPDGKTVTLVPFWHPAPHPHPIPPWPWAEESEKPHLPGPHRLFEFGEASLGLRFPTVRVVITTPALSD